MGCSLGLAWFIRIGSALKVTSKGDEACLLEVRKMTAGSYTCTKACAHVTQHAYPQFHPHHHVPINDQRLCPPIQAMTSTFPPLCPPANCPTHINTSALTPTSKHLHTPVPSPTPARARPPCAPSTSSALEIQGCIGPKEGPLLENP